MSDKRAGAMFPAAQGTGYGDIIAAGSYKPYQRPLCLTYLNLGSRSHYSRFEHGPDTAHAGG